ncbi:MAG: purine-nucleoside phosphorylase [Desulfuromonas sp.]|uniref:purine-nucleoside phosphorylase n=1 Tax=Desulfuromonas sp. TaxID=892 RepID=UPI000CA8189E|nr:purine-nucleoside phosphorylase [Desulfuromonas sp.]PLX83984.1 MAG: purine-nucleoside phosphorylase [Desulfuromonas sp.]
MAEGDLLGAAAELRRLTGTETFELAVVLGSGLGDLAEQVDGALAIDYPALKCFPPTGVSGHAGRLVAGTLEGFRVLVFQGRYHLYEGYDALQVTLPVRLAGALGCSRLLLSNAAGGINPDYRPGDFMFIADHINLMGDNPLRGAFGNPFLDLTHLYKKDLYPQLLAFAGKQGIRLHSGVLAALTGPSYETPAEIRALSVLGADAVSMSTVPEAIMGRHLGMDVAGLSLISNVAAGLSAESPDHGEVLAAGRQGALAFGDLLRHLLLLWRGESGSES